MQRSIVSPGFAVSRDRFSSVLMALLSRAPAARSSAAMVGAGASEPPVCGQRWRSDLPGALYLFQGLALPLRALLEAFLKRLLRHVGAMLKTEADAVTEKQFRCMDAADCSWQPGGPAIATCKPATPRRGQAWM